MKRVVILGATGSVGRQALEVAAAHPQLQVVGLAANRSAGDIIDLARSAGAERIALTDHAAARTARNRFDGAIHAGPAAASELIVACEADVVLNAIVGACGLDASLASLEAGCDLALANKESLVAGGALVTAALRRSGRRLLPVDSEHSALFQCLRGQAAAAVEGIILTASGGPFRGADRARLERVTPADALEHPTWRMGAKITIDAATLMNKGLEVIEAHFLFGLSYDRIDVVIQPQSIVHAMVMLRDGAFLAHLGLPDMRVPISYALTYPDRAATGAARLDLQRVFSLHFEPPDLETFPALRLARQAGEAAGTAPCVLNAANEEAVTAFLAGRIRFVDIPALVADALDHSTPVAVDSLDTVRVADHAARTLVRDRIGAVA